MRWLLGAVLTAVLLFTAGQAARAQDGRASVETTAELAQMCRMEDHRFCYGYLNGAGQFYQALVQDPDIDMNPFVCPGREVSEEEAIGTFLDWFEQHPDAASEPTIDGLFRAWVAAFPCA